MDPYDKATNYARERGSEDGKAAASWITDGNTSDATYRRLLDGITDGDPEVLDTLPSPDLSGEMADTLTGPALVEAAIVNADDWTMTRDEWRAYWAACEPFTDICDAYEDAYRQAVEAELLRVARYHLQPESDGRDGGDPNA